MELTVTRTWYTDHSVCGTLAINGEQYCFTLEPPVEPDPVGNGYTCIPAGSYQAIIAVSPKFSKILGYPFKVPLLQNVPGRSGIEMHRGNFPNNSDGCILLGMSHGVDYVGESTIALAGLLRVLPEGEFTVNIL